MSVKIMAEVWEHAQAKGSELLLLLALADHADSTTAECWPSVKRLAKMIRMSERNTQYLLRKLQAEEHIVIQLRSSPRKTNLYRILRPWCKDCTRHKGAGATSCTLDGAKALAPDPNSEPKPEDKESARVEDPEVLLRRIGLTPGSIAWNAALNGHSTQELCRR